MVDKQENEVDEPKLGWFKRFMRTKTANYLIATGVLGFGMFSIAFGGGPIAMGAVSLAIEMYKVTPAYDRLVNTQLGDALHKVTQIVFSRFNRRAFKIIMGVSMLVAASAATGGALPIVLGAINLAGVVYNVVKEVIDLRKARRLCKQAAYAKQYKAADTSIKKMLENHRTLSTKLGISSLAAKDEKPDLIPPLGRVFAENVAANMWEGVASIGGALISAGGPVQAIAILSTTGEVSRDTRNELNAAIENRKLNKEIHSLGCKPEELELKVLEHDRIAKALEKTMQEVSLDDEAKFEKAFKDNKALLDSELLPSTEHKPFPVRAWEAVKNTAKDIFSLHTSPINDPVERTYKKYHKEHDAEITSYKSDAAFLAQQKLRQPQKEKVVQQIKSRYVSGRGKGVGSKSR